MGTRTTGGGQRALGGSGTPKFGYSTSLPPGKPKKEWANAVTAKVRDNGDLTLEVGDRIRHADFGDGSVTSVTQNGAKSIAEVQFEKAGRKRLLVKIAPIEKL
jgi:DNA helicase II / ATP-dependent DNA helicase PcrA